MFRNLFILFSIFAFVFSSKGYTKNYHTDTHKSSTWENYYQNTINITDPYKTLLLAHKYFQMENINIGKAADLGV